MVVAPNAQGVKISSAMTLRARLTLGFLAIAVLLVIPLGIALSSLRSVQRMTQQLQSADFTASLELARAVRALESVREKEKVFPIFADSESTPPFLAALDSLTRTADSLGALGHSEPASELRQTSDTLRAALERLRAAVAVVDTVAVDSITVAWTQPAIQRAESTITATGRTLEGKSRRIALAASDTATAAFDLAQWALALAVLISAGVAVLITRSISRPVRELQRGMQAVADGDFSRQIAISPQRDDEFGRLAESYQVMARQLSDLDKLKAEFVSVASHELKTPINVILGYLQLLDEGVYGPLTDRQREVVATLGSQGQSLARLVQQLLDISRFEAGGGRIDVRDITLTRFIAELETAFHVLSMQRDVSLHILCADDLPTVVRWDPDRMSEVLGNLLSNAFKFTERGGRVELEVSRVGDDVRMIVRDTGAGIPTSQLQHVFRKFYQADNQSAASLKGTGLGLAIAKEIIEAHGGQITVDSTPGVGTTFCLELPILAVARRLHITVPEMAMHGSGR